MKTMFILIKRNIKMFFKDKGAFFGTFISPAILLVLYVTFLGNVFRDSLVLQPPYVLRHKQTDSLGYALHKSRQLPDETFLWKISQGTMVSVPIARVIRLLPG